MSESDKSGKPELDAAIKFLEYECWTYEPFTPHGLNKLPYALFESVGKAMVNYSAHENRAAQARIAELEARHQWKSIAEHGLPPAMHDVMWLTSSKRIFHNNWMAHTNQDDEWARMHFTHWREVVELP